jgi:hypothetical protein
MKDLLKNPITYLGIVWIIAFGSLLIFIINDDVKLNVTGEITKLVEQAYFEGQRDALENNIRIKRNQDSCWIWITSPWDSGREPIFDPSFNCK